MRKQPWSFKIFDWNTFAEKCEHKIENSGNYSDPTKMYKCFMKILSETIKEIMPQRERKNMTLYLGGQKTVHKVSKKETGLIID